MSPSSDVRDRTIPGGQGSPTGNQTGTNHQGKEAFGVAKADEYLFEEDAEARSFNNDRPDYPDEESYLASRGQ